MDLPLGLPKRECVERRQHSLSSLIDETNGFFYKIKAKI